MQLKWQCVRTMEGNSDSLGHYWGKDEELRKGMFVTIALNVEKEGTNQFPYCKAQTRIGYIKF